MSLTQDDIRKIAQLAKLTLSDAETAKYTEQLSNLLTLVDQMNTVNTDAIAPIANPFELNQRLRTDAVTEENQRDAFQAIAPAVEAGLYLVPKVIETAETETS